jgi:Raf kinase inhibitor-like YbhB/YbcL family protein
MKTVWFILGCCIAMAAQGFGQGVGFRLNSPTWHEGGTVPMENVFNGSGCNGKNSSPALSWSGAPQNTKSFAVTLFDPDAPTGHGFWHWTVFNLPANTTELVAGAGSRPPGGAVQAKNDWGTTGYGGPCPPSGSTHRYVLTVWALNVEHLQSQADTSPAKAAAELRTHTLGTAQMTVRFGH